MGKVENVIKMLFMLKKNEVIKCKDIAEELEVKERQVRCYKDILSDFVEIESIPGRYGGYILRDDAMFPIKEILREDEMELVKDFINGLDSNLMDGNTELKKAIDKINYTIKSNEENCASSIIPYSRVKPLDDNQRKIKEDIHKSCIESNEVIIEYGDNKGTVDERRIQPYKLITYKGEYYLYAFCLKRNAIRNFKLKRIKKCIVTNKKFVKSIDMDKHLANERKNSIGIFGGEEYDLELLIRNPMANTVKERIWVDNQVIDEESYPEGIVFKAKMKGGQEILSWILSMGESVTVVKPEVLKTKIREKLEKMIKNL